MQDGLAQTMSTLPNSALQILQQNQAVPLGDYTASTLGGAAGPNPAAMLAQEAMLPNMFDVVQQQAQSNMYNARQVESNFLQSRQQQQQQNQSAWDHVKQAVSGAWNAVTGGNNNPGAGTPSAADNQGLTGQQIDQWIQRTRPNSPMVGQGQFILDQANAAGVSVPEMLGIFLKESQLGTTAGPTWNVAGVGGLGNFAGYGNVQDAIAGAIQNLAGSYYRGKSLADNIGTWYVGPDWQQKGGLQAVDASGGANGTVGDYLGIVQQVYNQLGVHQQAGEQPGTALQAGSIQGGGDALRTITGGQDAPISQDFGATDYSQANPATYAYETTYGMQPGQHTGLDLGVAAGSQLYTPVGGTVQFAGGTGFYRDEDENGGYDGPGVGELMIQLDNGDQLILGHMRQITVQAGQRINPGAFVGYSGAANGPHVHVEVRMHDPSLASGYRIVDPRWYFGQGQPANNA